MAIAVDQNLGHAVNTASATTCVLTTTATAAANSFLVGVVAWYNNSNTLSGVATTGLSWTVDKQLKSSSINAAIISAQCAAGLASGSTITATINGTAAQAIMVGVTSFTGMVTSSVIDGTPGSASGSTAAWTSGAITTTNTDDLVCGAAMWDGGSDTTSTPAGSYVEAQDFGAGTGDNCTLVYQIFASSGTPNPGGTWASTSSWAAVSCAYKGTAGGGATAAAVVTSPFNAIPFIR